MWKSIILIIAVLAVLQALLFLYKTSYRPNGGESPLFRPRPLNVDDPVQTAIDSALNETTTSTQWPAAVDHDKNTHKAQVQTGARGPSESRCGYGLKWTSLKQGADNDTAFFSAYYDERRNAPNRPAVVVLGYHMKSLKDPNLRCVFTFRSGSSVCSDRPVEGVGKACINIHDDGKLATSYMYICPLSCAEATCDEDEIPLSVAIGTGSKCDGESETIPVQDCRPKQVERKKKAFGVCPSPVYNLGLQDLIEFIEMTKALGVDLVNLYFIPGMDKDMIEYLRERYSKDGALDLEMFQWRELYLHKIVHYNGQMLAIHDCIYRNMYRAEYLIATDLDELIIPLKHSNYMEMIKSYNADSHVHSFGFLNRFFALNGSPPPVLPNCSGLTLPKYFHRTNQLRCMYSFSFRPKYIMRPQMVIQVAVHGVCKVTEGRGYHVPARNAILGHFRNIIPSDCKDRRTSNQVALVKYQARVTQQMCMYT